MERSKVATRTFTVEFASAIKQISEAPDRWGRYECGTHRFIFANFPFSVIYRVRNEVVQIITVAHHRRKPGYWHKR